MDRIAPYSRNLLLGLLAAASLFPFFFLLINAVKSEAEFSADPLGVPTAFQWSQYSRALEIVAGPILNSVIIVGLSVAGTLAFAALSAYAFTFIDFPGRKALFFLVFILLLIPGVLTLIPLYLQIQRLDRFGVSDTWLALVLPYIAAGQAFSIFVLRTFFGGISRELIDAARVDGASEFHIFTRIVLPLSIPVLASVAVVNIVPLWNDFLLPALLLSEKYRTLTMALVTLQGNAQTHTASQFGTLMAAYVIACVPLAIVFAFLMKYYVQGLTTGAVKL